MAGLEIKLFLANEEARKLKELEKQSDYFVIKDVKHHYASSCARATYDLGHYSTVKIEIFPSKGSLYENASELFLKLKEFENKDSLPLDG